jgi:hypothetical protein
MQRFGAPMINLPQFIQGSDLPLSSLIEIRKAESDSAGNSAPLPPVAEETPRQYQPYIRVRNSTGVFHHLKY